MDIVRRRIAVGNTEYLTALQRNNMWLVGATLLVERNRSAGNLKLALEAVFYPDEHIRQSATIANEGYFGMNRAAVEPCASSTALLA